MTGEIKFFRKRFIGGFNRQDVIDYITVISKEREKDKAIIAKAEQDARGYMAEIESLMRERDEAMRLAYEYRSEVLEEAKKTLVEIEASFKNLCTGFEEETAGICEQLETARNIVAILPSAIKKAAIRFNGLRDMMDKV